MDKESKWEISREDKNPAIPVSGIEVLSVGSNAPVVRIDHKFSEQDFTRFSEERAAFRADPRLRPAVLPRHTGSVVDLDWQSTLKGSLGIFRLGDYFTEPFRDLVVERLVEQGSLMEHFEIPRLLDTDSTKPLHSTAVPKHGSYGRLRLQAYWLALHIWLLHSKQNIVQVEEGIFGSALCALITRRLFEWQWEQVRGWMHEVDVPVMSLTAEVQDLQEYVFGLCVALDQAFTDEAPSGTASALALGEQDLIEGRHGLAPQVKHVLWANVYSGICPHDAPYLHDLTVYVLRQRVLLEGLARGEFFMCRWNWGDFAAEH